MSRPHRRAHGGEGGLLTLGQQGVSGRKDRFRGNRHGVFKPKATPRRRLGWTPDAESGKITSGTAEDRGGLADSPAR